MDRRLTPATDRVAHASLRGVLDRPAYTDGTPLRVITAMADLRDQPAGRRDRQLWLGDDFRVIDRDQGYAFGHAGKDGYCGWLPEATLGDAPDPTHHISSPATHLYPEPRVQSPEIATLPMGARVFVTGRTAAFSQTPHGFIPTPHLAPLGHWATDPVAVAERLLETPYLWGGNSRAGIDCSGLVQLAFLACGLPCPADSDLQQTLGTAITDNAHQRGDLMFWPGHVAIVTDPHTLIHANGHTMSVAYEPIVACINRIAQHTGADVTTRRRPFTLAQISHGGPGV